MREFGQIPFPLDQILGIFCSLLFWPHYWVYLILRKWIRPTSMPINAALLTLLEYLVPQQFPAHLGHSWLTMAPYLGLAPIFGVPLYSFVSYYGVQALTLAISQRKYPDPFFLCFLLLFLGVNIAFPLSYKERNRSLQVRVVQPNIGNVIKLASEQGDDEALRIVREQYYRMSIAPFEHPIDLIIWPETAVAEVLDSRPMASGESEFPYYIQTIALQMNAELVTGGYDTADGPGPLYFEDQYNTLFHIGDRGEFKEVYHKNQLLSFGETMPFGPLNITIARSFPHASFFARGKQRPLFTLRDGSRFIPAICYEILSPSFIRQYLNELENRPHFIINITNDSWYGDTSEPLQHFFLSRWRAIELNLPIVRSTNTGITSVLFPDGSESRRITVGKKDNLDLSLSLRETTATPYQRYGILSTLLVMIIVAAVNFGLFLRKKVPL